MIESEQHFAEPSRQSPLAVVFLAWRIVRRISIVNVVVAVVAVSSGRLPFSGLGLAVAVLAFLAVSGTLSWWRFVFVIKDGELRVDKGVLSQEHLAIPLSRIQTVGLEQGLLHQILGLTQVSVDTAGSSGVEFKFDALDRHRAELLRQVVDHHRSIAEPSTSKQAAIALESAAAPTGPPAGAGWPSPAATGAASATSAPIPPAGYSPEPEIIAERSFLDLVKIGLGSWPWAGLVFVFPLLAIAEELQQLVGLDLFGGFSDWVDEVEEGGFDPEVEASVVAASIVGFAILATLAGWTFQIARSVLANWEMTLTRTRTASGDSLRRDAGLLNRTTLSANLARVQGIRSFQAPMQRWFGIHNTTLLITGETNIQIPGATDAELETVKKLTLTGPGPVLNREISKSHIVRELRTAVLIGSVVGVVTYVTLGWWGLLAMLIPVQALVGSILYWKSMRWGFTNLRIGYRHGFVNRRKNDVEFVKAQSVTVRQSWFERRRGLATFRLESAEAHFSVPFITKSEAEALRDLVLFDVESSGRSWM